MVLQGPRVRLRAARPGDAVDIAHLANDPEVAKWLLHLPHPYTEQDALRFVRSVDAARRRGDEETFLATFREKDQVLGVVGLRDISVEHRRAELGYWLGRAHWGKGLATEAVAVLLRHGFGPLGLHRITAGVFPGNVASVRVLEKLGFQREGVNRQHFHVAGRYVDEVRYGLLHSELTVPEDVAGGVARTTRPP